MSHGWRLATIAAIREETSSARTLVLDLLGWPGHLAGQHVKVRLLPGEGDRTERSFSIASPPEQPTVELTIERLPAGKVSGVLCGDVDVGYRLYSSQRWDRLIYRDELARMQRPDARGYAHADARRACGMEGPASAHRSGDAQRDRVATARRRADLRLRSCGDGR